MITVYVWLPSEHSFTGHASMKIAGNLSETELAEIRKELPSFSSYDEAYISWYPSSMNPFGDGEATNMQYDFAGPQPDFTQELSGLDESAMRTFWYRFKYKHPKSNWHLFSNCATVVAHALRAGGGPFYFSFNVTWTPRQVKEYAIQIAGTGKSKR